MEFKDYVRIVLSHWAGVLVLAILGVAAAFGYNATQPNVYQAGATGLVTATSGPSTGSSDPNGSALANASIGDALAKSRVTSYLSIAKSTEVATAVLKDPSIRGLGLPTSTAGLANNITASQPQDTVLIQIKARGPSPKAAAALANAWGTALAAKVAEIDGSPDATSAHEGLHMATLSSAQAGYLVLPRTKLNLVVGLVVGLLLGFAYALVRHQFDRKLRSSEDVEKQFGIPVIGMIPQSSSMRQEGSRELVLAVIGTAASTSASTAEAFRKLRTNLAFMDVDDPPRVIVVTSPKQSDGKSTVAANLAAAIAIGGQPVTLIDGDLRRPTVADSLAMVDGAGLTDVLVGRVQPAEVIQDHPDVPGLRVLASGAIPPNPSELLGSRAMKSLVHELAEDAMVIIDAPPLLPVTDAAVLTPSADGAIVVIGHNSTLDSELAASLGHIASVHGRTLGIVFNRMRRTATSGLYGGDYYRYEYKPESGRRKQKPRKSKQEPVAKA
jgi:capsular exopolysaccharide synthesis family protein